MSWLALFASLATPSLQSPALESPISIPFTDGQDCEEDFADDEFFKCRRCLKFGNFVPDSYYCLRCYQGSYISSKMPESTRNVPVQMFDMYSMGASLPSGSYEEYQFNTPAVAPNAQGHLSSMQNLKAALPTLHGNMEYNKNGRAAQNNNPLMVMPSGQTVPLSAFQNQSQLNYHNNNLSYVPNGLIPGLMSGNSYTPAPMGQFQYGFNNIRTVGNDVDPSHHGVWSVHDENAPIGSSTNVAAQNDYYPISHQFTHPANTFGQYLPGPIQPMKTVDNKDYEMVNLDHIVQRDPTIPRAVPALWTNQEDMTLAKCLQNPEGITNVYIRGFMPDTTDEDLHGWASRFGEIESCKAIIDQDTGKCKGFGFVMYYSPAASENCIRGFFHLGFQASYAQKSRNSRLKDLEDRSSTNIYCTGVPIDWNEADLAKHFLPYAAVSTKICRDSPSGVSKEVGFARFESREVAERVIRDFHSVMVEHDAVKLYLRFADTKAQKQLKQQSQERRQWRSREYSFSVEHTPSPISGRLQGLSHISPNGSYHSIGAGNNFTPATSVSPQDVVNPTKNLNHIRSSAWPTSGGLQSITNQPTSASRSTSARSMQPHIEDVNTATKVTSVARTDTKTPSPKKVTIKIEPASGKENLSPAGPSSKSA